MQCKFFFYYSWLFCLISFCLTACFPLTPVEVDDGLGRPYYEKASFPPVFPATNDALIVLDLLDVELSDQEKRELGQWINSKFDLQSNNFKNFGELVSQADLNYYGIAMLKRLEQPFPVAPELMSKNFELLQNYDGSYAGNLDQRQTEPPAFPVTETPLPPFITGDPIPNAKERPTIRDSSSVLRSYQLLGITPPNSDKTLEWLNGVWSYYQEKATTEEAIEGLSSTAQMIYLVDGDEEGLQKRWAYVLKLWQNYYKSNFLEGLEFAHLTSLIDLAIFAKIDSSSWLSPVYVKEVLQRQNADGGYGFFPTENQNSDWLGTWGAAHISHYSGVPIPSREKMIEFVQSWRTPKEESPAYVQPYTRENGNQ